MLLHAFISVALLSRLGLGEILIEQNSDRRGSGEARIGSFSNSTVDDCRRRCQRSTGGCTSFTLDPDGLCTLDASPTSPCAMLRDGGWVSGIVVNEWDPEVRSVSGVAPVSDGSVEVWSCTGYAESFRDVCAHDLAQDPECTAGVFTRDPAASASGTLGYICFCFSRVARRTFEYDGIVAYWQNI